MSDLFFALLLAPRLLEELVNCLSAFSGALLYIFCIGGKCINCLSRSRGQSRTTTSIAAFSSLSDICNTAVTALNPFWAYISTVGIVAFSSSSCTLGLVLEEDLLGMLRLAQHNIYNIFINFDKSEIV